MRSKTHLILPDPHAHYQHSNVRAEWVGHLINDVKPDVVINMGDTADMPSLSGYDKGRKCFQGRTYKQDIDVHNDFQERLWSVVRKAKKKLPRRVTLIGNHEERIERAIQMSPELEGAIGYGDLSLDTWYDTIVHYNGGTPGVIELDNIHYAHYFISGVMGRAIGGLHPAASLVAKQHRSCTSGHIHLLDYSVNTTIGGDKIAGLQCGCYLDYDLDWAGNINDLWWSGVIVKRNVEDGFYDLETISIDALRKTYG